MVRQESIPSQHLPTPRQVWVHPSLSDGSSDCLIFLDGELYRDRVKAPDSILAAQAARILPPVTSIYVSNVDSAARHSELTCNESFAAFLATDLCHWIEQSVGRFDRLFLCGLSLSGLAAAFTASGHPGVFSGILCQSPSAWWNDEWLTESIARPNAKHRARYWISVGNQEVQENISHAPTGLLQKTSQLESVRRLARKLEEFGHDVHFVEFDGGHDPSCWGAELPQALAYLLGRADPSNPRSA